MKYSVKCQSLNEYGQEMLRRSCFVAFVVIRSLMIANDHYQTPNWSLAYSILMNRKTLNRKNGLVLKNPRIFHDLKLEMKIDWKKFYGQGLILNRSGD